MTLDLTKLMKDTLKMTDVGARCMGGPTKDEARNYLRKLGWSKKRIAKLEDVIVREPIAK
jgi:hypothetical protein